MFSIFFIYLPVKISDTDIWKEASSNSRYENVKKGKIGNFVTPKEEDVYLMTS